MAQRHTTQVNLWKMGLEKAEHKDCAVDFIQISNYNDRKQIQWYWKLEVGV